jgi:pre-rRNA-processing protein TSR1
MFMYVDDVIASKEVLWVVCGFRKWKARPLFSMNNLNSDKHKSERFLLGGAGHFTVASCYGPATYTPCPFLLFREKVNVLSGGGDDSSTTMQLVGHGVIGSVDVDRIVLKRVILTGYPARVHKRTAIIKHMFQKPEDVMWFKPAPLVTKLGLEGHIVCPVGDHGLFRVHFGRPVKGHDTICLHLYKRVYPKFAEVAAGEQDDDGAGALTLSVL